MASGYLHSTLRILHQHSELTGFEVHVSNALHGWWATFVVRPSKM